MIPGSSIVVRTGFSLVELVVTSGIVAVLCMAIVSTMTLMSRSMPASDGKAEQRAQSSACAGSVGGRTRVCFFGDDTSRHEILFTVPDRDKDGQPETIHYTWSGIAGDAITREYNGAAGVLLSAASDFTLGCVSETRSISAASGTVEGPEVLMSAYQGPSSSGAPFGISTWLSQYFTPELPANAVSFSVTRLRVQMRKTALIGADTINLQLKRAKADTTPSSTLLCMWTQASLAVNGSSYQWMSYTTSSVTGLAPGSGLCLVMSGLSLGTTADLPVQVSSVPDARASYARTTNSGTSWTTYPDGAFNYEVYGKVTTPGSLNVLQDHARAFTISVGAGSDASRTVSTTITAVARPSIPMGAAAAIAVGG